MVRNSPPISLMKGRKEEMKEQRNPTSELAVPLLQHVVLSTHVPLALVINLIIFYLF